MPVNSQCRQCASTATNVQVGLTSADASAEVIKWWNCLDCGAGWYENESGYYTMEELRELIRQQQPTAAQEVLEFTVSMSRVLLPIGGLLLSGWLLSRCVW